MHLTGLIGPAAALALLSVEAFDHLSSAEHELREGTEIYTAPGPRLATKVFQLPELDCTGLIPTLKRT